MTAYLTEYRDGCEWSAGRFAPVGFEPIRTERLILRRPVLSDAEAAYQRRSLPEVARYQGWEIPYTRERAEKSTAEAVAMDGPTDGQGWTITVVDAAAPDRILGDLCVELRWGGRSAVVGFTFHPDHWGKGYATEGTQALIRYLSVDLGVSRIEASLHPDNPASARVLEACGLVFEGLTRQSFWVGDECSDDMLYGMTRPDGEAWANRPRNRPGQVDLVPVTGANRRAVGELVTHKSQERFVSPMLGNFRDAVAPPEEDGGLLVPWYRAIVADGVVAGFLMAAEATPTMPNPYLWRLLVDRMHQRRGIGSAALDRFEQWCRDQGATAIEVSWVEGPGSPASMYQALGYEPSGRLIDGEIHAVKRLS
jgi:RimJ/RimL family protein N-acetyltransferase/ribosomal protein S18 acetylase RimI-like enzyme